MTEKMPNINTATKEEIEKLPFIGEQRAEMVVHYIKVHGNLHSVDDVAKITGFNQALAERIGEYFSFGADEKHTAKKTAEA